MNYAAFKLDSEFKKTSTLVSRVFDLVKVAEEEIAAVTERYPGKAPELRKAFMLVSPTAGMSDLAPQVYRHHARELLERVARGKDTRLGTSAEVLVALSEASLKYPLPRDETELATRIAAQVFSEHKDELLKGSSSYSHKKAGKELLEKLRRQLRKPDRRL